MEDNNWLEDKLSWTAQNLLNLGYVKDQDEWEIFKEALEDFVMNFLEGADYDEEETE